MKTFRDARICGDPDDELLKTSKWKANGECWTCGRRKGRKLLGGPIPIDTGPIKHGSSRGPCCALKPEECCMPNPYASSGLPYDAARDLIVTVNVLFWIYIVLLIIVLSCGLSSYENGEGPCIIFQQTFFVASWFTLLFWSFPLWFPLYIVASFGYLECCIRPLHWSARNGHLEVVRALIKAGADVNAKDNDGWTPLHYSAWNGHLEVARALIEAGADVNAKENGGSTPLHAAAEKGHKSVIKILENVA